MLLGLGAALAAAVVFGGSSILQAVGSRKVDSSDNLGPRLALALLRQPAFVAALLLNLVGFLLHLVAVRTLPLFLAQGGIAASLVITALLAVRVFHDQLSSTEWVAIVAITVGLALLTASAGVTGDDRATPQLEVAAFAVIGVMVVGGLVAGRANGPAAAVTLSVLAGLGFSNTAVSSRLLPGLSVPDLLTEPIAYALPVSGALAFLLYSQALQRSSVTVATAPMLVLQTAAPAVLGVALLGDVVRPGWELGAVAGLLLTAAGASVLVRFEGVRENTRTG